jgi:heme iron utilization protein
MSTSSLDLTAEVSSPQTGLESPGQLEKRPFDPHRDGGFDPQPGVARLSHAVQARTLLDEQSAGFLSTLSRPDANGAIPTGTPFGSLVSVLAADDGSLWILISAMAEHTGNLDADPRASVLVSQTAPPEVDPLALSRLTLIGAARRERPTSSIRIAYLERHPGASRYVDFPDFGWFRLEPLGVRYVGGFGRMSWISIDDFRTGRPDPIAPFRDGICTHMNDDHRDSHAVLLNAQLRASADMDSGLLVSDAVMTSVDALGCDLDAETNRGRFPLRLAFPEPVSTPDQVRHSLVSMLTEARRA